MSESEKLVHQRIHAQQQSIDNAIEGRRQRKNPKQMEILEQEFELNPTKWTIAECVKIGDSIGMVRTQVSKWNWDQRKKMGIDTSRRTG